MQQINWGMIGCGNVTEVKSGPAFNKADGSRLVAVMRRNGDKARDYAQRHGVGKWTSDADEIIHDPQIDAVYVATPPDSHCDYAIRCAHAGKPAYVEKPMARTHAEYAKMVHAAEEAATPLFVAYYRRCLPNFLQVRDLLAQGAIGQVRFVTIDLIKPLDKPAPPESLPWRVQPEIAGGGYFFDLASHQFDYLDFLFGPVTSVKGIARNQAAQYAAEDVVSASFEFQSGVVGSGIWCFTSAECNRTDRIEIVGDRGKIVLSAFERVPFRLVTESGSEEFDLPTPEHIQQPLIQAIVNELLGEGTCPSTGETAARTNSVMDHIIEEYRQTRRQKII